MSIRITLIFPIQSATGQRPLSICVGFSYLLGNSVPSIPWQCVALAESFRRPHMVLNPSTSTLPLGSCTFLVRIENGRPLSPWTVKSCKLKIRFLDVVKRLFRIRLFFPSFLNGIVCADIVRPAGFSWFQPYWRYVFHIIIDRRGRRFDI